jgi:energy-coupling factor transport system substrate-specific component
METKRKLDKMTLFLIPIGVAVNFIGGQIAILLKLPLYLDAIGTIVVGALCGGIPGAIVGLVSNVLNSITSPITLFYGILSIMFGFVAAWFSKKGVFKSFAKTLLSSLLFALIGGGLGAIMTWILYGFDFGVGASVMFSIPLHQAVGLPKFLAQFIAEFLMDVLDKIITIVAVFFVLKAMPLKLLSRLSLGHVYIKDSDKVSDAGFDDDEDD